MTTVYLDDWEWDCCGDPFTVGDRVTLQVRDASAALRALLGGTLGAHIDAAESHHEIDPDDPPARGLVGVVRSIVGVAVDHTEHREPRLPAPTPIAPPQMPVDGGVWLAVNPVSERPDTIVSTPVDGTGRTVPVSRVPAVPRFSEEEDAAGTPPTEPIIGYLVELDPC